MNPNKPEHKKKEDSKILIGNLNINKNLYSPIHI